MENNYKFIEVEISGDLVFLKLNRPDKGNALHSEMITEIITAFEFFETKDELRFVVISGNGKSFCSGADLHWMANAINLSEEENYDEALQLANLFSVIYFSSKITISTVHGACFGGGVGIAAATDFVISSSDAFFSFTEVRLGITPATISPYIINRIGSHIAKKVMLTGERIFAETAFAIGLVDQLSVVSDFYEPISILLDNLRKGGPNAQGEIKKLVHFQNQFINDEIKFHTAWLIAHLRNTDEAREGINAFLEKRLPKW
jgi:methylglutaconyl-CoA hydratase